MLGKVGDVSEPEPIGCEGSTSEITVGLITGSGILGFSVNDESLGFSRPFRDGIPAIMATHGISMIALDENNNIVTQENSPDFSRSARAHFVNNSNEYKRIQIEIGDASQVKTNYTPANASFNFDTVTQITTFCLAPAN